VVHPGKHDDMDGFGAVVGKAMTDQGWAEPLWLETSLEPGIVGEDGVLWFPGLPCWVDQTLRHRASHRP
jgi:hypothetical protein